LKEDKGIANRFTLRKKLENLNISLIFLSANFDEFKLRSLVMTDFENIGKCFVLYFFYCVFIIFSVKIVEQLGGKGKVFVVIDPDTNEKYVIKRISTKDYKEYAKEHISALLLLNKKAVEADNVVEYLGYFEEKGFVHLMMEYCEKGNLEDYLNAFQNTPIPQLVSFLLLFL
jgi:hypothetical protein